jgi:hypothetical protein
MKRPENIDKLRAELKKIGCKLTVNKDGTFTVKDSEWRSFWVFSYDWSTYFEVLGPPHPTQAEIRSAFLHVINCPD